jgi:hypothetical protein
MNKLVASIGIVALGTSVIQAVESSALNSMQDTKPWSISAALRGFYDDNINAAPAEVDSLGFQVEPSFDFGMVGEQTSVNLGYTFSASYYEDRPVNETDNWTYTHVFDVALSHTFNPRLDMFVRDSFALGQEPDMLRASGGAGATVTRVSGDNIRNNAAIDFNAEMTQLLGFSFGYNNNLYEYDDGSDPNSNSSLLDRMEHVFQLDSNWKLRPQTTGILGYTYAQTLYTADQEIIGAGSGVYSEDRNSLSHIFYAGAQHNFTPTLSGLLKVGAQYVDYYNDPNDADSTISPYVQGTLRYAFQTTTTFDLGFTYSHSPADTAGISATDVTLDMETAVLYGSVSHEIVRHLVGTLTATGQYGTYQEGTFDGDNQIFYQLGARLAYQFTPNLSTHVSYNFDKLDSDLPNRSYDRNRIFLGVTASY